MGKVLALHVVNQSSFPDTPYGLSLSPEPGVSPEHQWVWTENSNNKNTQNLTVS